LARKKVASELTIIYSGITCITTNHFRKTSLKIQFTVEDTQRCIRYLFDIRLTAWQQYQKQKGRNTFWCFKPFLLKMAHYCTILTQKMYRKIWAIWRYCYHKKPKLRPFTNTCACSLNFKPFNEQFINTVWLECRFVSQISSSEFIVMWFCCVDKHIIIRPPESSSSFFVYFLVCATAVILAYIIYHKRQKVYLEDVLSMYFSTEMYQVFSYQMQIQVPVPILQVQVQV